MEGNERLRRSDFVTSIILVLFGLFILSQALQMPMKDTWGGVVNVWYVSPALMPLIVSVAILSISILLLVHSIRSGGARFFFESLATRKSSLSDGSFRFLAILLALIAFVFLNIPRIDFFLAITLFLLYFISIFYFDDIVLLKKLTLFYLIGSVIIAAIFAFSLDGPLNAAFMFSTDVLQLLFIVLFWVYARVLVGGDAGLRRKLRMTLIVAIATPLVLCPIFKYFLLVPLPHEGGILQLMDLVRYSFGR
ncbi:MAG TPA: hypothetical protein VMV68_06640 [Spirochaetia bacterium]|nr:hypothetical protein [Spirochaetia bacterium]